ncbi:YIP1 family protein [Halorhabdus sp. BNX81]|uniref:YIP1 family protein n=1 Tax=Halorhabdus sp. BNX81 TaxID=2980181 RepID=UPI0023DD2A43|nr:YIP1 family protein [Halorhabdus sp. BNX81]WEL21517.1 putative conserved membrane protein, Yip1family [Halorhabdus sp. BNX81]
MAPTTPLRSPSEYFQRNDRPSLLLGAGIILSEAILVAILAWQFLRDVMAQIDMSPAERASVEGVINNGVFRIFISIFLGWLLIAAILHVFVWFADGDRGFGTTLAVVGEADLVSIVLLPVTAAGLFLMVGTVPSDPAEAARFLERTGVHSSAVGLFASIFGLVWKASIQGIGLAEAHDVSVSKMLTVTFVLGFLGFLLNLA